MYINGILVSWVDMLSGKLDTSGFILGGENRTVTGEQCLSKLLTMVEEGKFKRKAYGIRCTKSALKSILQVDIFIDTLRKFIISTKAPKYGTNITIIPCEKGNFCYNVCGVDKYTFVISSEKGEFVQLICFVSQIPPPLKQVHHLLNY